MTEEPLLTLRQVADELALPESTVRYYRDAFPDHIPVIGMGRRRRYPPPAVAALRSIADGYAAGRSRRAILGALGVALPEAEPRSGAPVTARPPLPEASSRDLLAAILDGQREQRDALWEMAREIVRLGEVLEGHERALLAIADPAGARAALPPVTPAPAAPAEGGPSAPEMERLRGELETERQLVERLREAKVKLEHRVSDAEAELEERRGRARPSVLGRLFGPGTP